MPLPARPIHAAAVHYWRLERERWDDVLDAVRDLGFSAVSVYVPWEAHELERGSFDFGEHDPRLDLDAFLTLCEERELDLVARPGPQINAEMTWFGYPKRILADESLHARSARDSRAVLTQVPRPIPALSYANDAFFDEAAVWLDAVCAVLARHVEPHGRLLAAQVDNEMAFFFGINAWSGDFSPASLDRYRAFLRDKAGDIAALNAQYGTDHESFDVVDPPRRFSGTTPGDALRLADWAEYRERYLVDSIARLAGMLHERGLQNLPLFHNYPHPLNPGSASSGFSTPFNLAGLEEHIDFVGFDMYSRKEVYGHVKTLVSYVVGTSRFPYAPELIAGAWPWYQDPGDVRDEEFVAKAALMNGLRGFSRYTLVERDRWLASPIRRDGRVREDKGEAFARVNHLAREHLAGLRRRADVLLLANRDYDRLEAASVLVSFPGDFLESPTGFSEYPNALTVAESSLGFEQPVQLAKTTWFSDCQDALTDGGWAFLLSDTALAPARWQDYRVIVLASFEYLDADLQQAVLDFVTAGGVAVLGPRLPHLGARLEPADALRAECEAVGGDTLVVDGDEMGRSHAIGRGRVVVLTDARGLDAALLGVDVLRPLRNDHRLDVTMHDEPGGDARRLVVWVANPTDEPIRAEIDLELQLESATELWDDRTVAVSGSTLTDDLPPYTIAAYDCRLRS